MSAGTAEAARLVFECVATAHTHAGAVEQAALGSAAHNSAALAASERSHIRQISWRMMLDSKGTRQKNGSLGGPDLLPMHKTPLSPPKESLRK